MIPNVRRYVVNNQNDTFFNLANRFRCLLKQIMDANPGVVPEHLQIGQVVNIPIGNGQQIMNANAEVMSQPSRDRQVVNITDGNGHHIINSSNVTRHVIQNQNDTFHNLSIRYRCSLKEIMDANPGVVPEHLQIGQVVHIPVGNGRPDIDNFNMRAYRICSGDTFYDLAERFQCSLQEIMDANRGVVPGLLQIGEVINIPGHS